MDAITNKHIIYKCAKCGGETPLPSPETSLSIGYLYFSRQKNGKMYCKKCWRKYIKKERSR